MSNYSSTIQQVRRALKETFDEIQRWFDQPEAARNFKPADGGWSINEILEHITLTTHFLLIIVRNGYPKALKRAQTARIEDSESDLDLLIPIGQRGAFPWTRPEHMEPRGKPIDEVSQTMHQQQTECQDILSKIGSGEGSLYSADVRE